MTPVSRFPTASVARSAGNRELLAEYRRGDRGAAERLVERTYPGVYASLLRLCGDRDRAADLTQETYRKAWQSLDRFQGRSKVATWLYRIAYTTFLNHARAGSQIVPLEPEDAQAIPDPGPAQDQLIESSSGAQAARAAVLALPEKLRYTVTARYWADVPIREIARDVGVTPMAIRKRLEKALRLLAATLQETEQ